MLGWVLRTFRSRDPEVMKSLFKAMVLSKLDYCSLLIHPTLVSHTLKIEQVQRPFTCRISGMYGMNHWERLKYLKLYSVERRRERFIIIYTFKILHDLVPNPGIQFKTSKRLGINCIIPHVPTTIPSYIRQRRFQSFRFIAARLFNCLPIELRSYKPDCQNIVFSFKVKLDKFLSNIPDQPTVYGLQRMANTNSISDQIHYLNENNY